MSRHPSLLPVLLGVVLAASTVGCATATATSHLRGSDAPRGVVTRLADLRIAPGTDTVVTLTDGSILRGRLQSVSADALSIAIEGPDKTTAIRTVTDLAALIGRHTRDEHVEIVFKRAPAP